MKAYAVILVMLLPLQAAAQDRLEPEETVFGGDEFAPAYNILVASVLHDAFGDDIVVRMIGLPSFVPEYAVGIRKTGAQFEIFAIEPSEQLWGYANRHPIEQGRLELGADGLLKGGALKFPADVTHVAVNKCSVAISTPLANRIADVWRKMLLQVHYGGSDEMRIGLDGETFHFAMREGMDFMAGKIWSPGQGTNDAALVKIASDMRQICSSNNIALLPELDRQSAELLAKLN